MMEGWREPTCRYRSRVATLIFDFLIYFGLPNAVEHGPERREARCPEGWREVSGHDIGLMRS